METIRARARQASWEDNYHTIMPLYINGYVRGAEEQREIDIEKACEALYGLIDELGCDLMDIEKAQEYLRKAME